MGIKQKTIRLGNVYGDQFGKGFGGNVWGGQGLAPTLKSSGSVGQEFTIEVKQGEQTREDNKARQHL